MNRIMIFFDVDDTLYDQRVPLANAVHRLLPKETADMDMEKFFLCRSRRSDEVFQDSVDGKMSKEAMHIYRGKWAFADMGIDISDEQALRFQQLYEEEQKKLCLTPEAKELLMFLKEKKIPCGVITNGPGAHQREKVRILGLGQWIEAKAIVISGEIGITKPSKGIFREAEKRCGYQPEELVYIGDSWNNDVTGAENAGWKAVWYNKRGRALPCDADPSVEVITSLAEVKAWFSQENV